MTGEELKKAVLQAAIQGKLTDQRAEDGTAFELIQQIQEEKKRLICEGKIKKEKPLPPITEDEIPFDIPENWEWVRMGNITHNFGQKKPDSKFCYIDVGSIDNKNGKLGNDETILEAHSAPSRARKIVQKGCVIYSTVRPYLLNTCIIDRDFSFEPIASTAFCVLNPFKSVNSKYILFFLRSNFFTDYVRGTMVGVAYPAINDNILYYGCFPLPPLAEQKRIVQRIEELFVEIDKYAEMQHQLAALKVAFPNDLRKSVLQSAIQGKLTDQRAEDGTASELIHKIQEEKKRLIREGKIKKEKTLPPITEDEIPFDIPENWEWVRLGDLFIFLNGDRGKNYPSKSQLYKNGNIPFISAINIEKQSVSENGLLFVSQAQYDALHAGKLLLNDFVICIRGSLGKYCQYPFKIGAIASSLVIMRKIGFIIDHFLHIYLSSPVFSSEIKKYNNGTAQPNLAAKDLEKFLLPLPPLAEQKRIVQRIEELFVEIDHIEAKINQF